MTPRLGAIVDAGQVIAAGPDPGTWWAAGADPDIAGVVLDQAGAPVSTVTRAEQAARQARATRIAAGGVQILRTPTGEYRSRYVPVRAWTVHTLDCVAVPPEWGSRSDPLVWRDILLRADGVAAALAGDPMPLVPEWLRSTVRRGLEQLAWCGTCLNPSLEGVLR